MKSLARAGRLAMTLGASLLLVVGISSDVQADANGTLRYHSLDGNYYVGQYPHSDQCLPLVDGADFIDNETDLTAYVFHSGDFYCTSSYDELPPHSAKYFGPETGGYPYWIEFG